MPHPVVHFEIGCEDSARTRDFYQSLFDWKIDAMGPAAMIAAEAGGITGHITALGHEPHHYTIFYVGVDDVAAALQKANSLGAKTLVPPTKAEAALGSPLQSEVDTFEGFVETLDEARELFSLFLRAFRVDDLAVL